MYPVGFRFAASVLFAVKIVVSPSSSVVVHNILPVNDRMEFVLVCCPTIEYLWSARETCGLDVKTHPVRTFPPALRAETQ